MEGIQFLEYVTTPADVTALKVLIIMAAVLAIAAFITAMIKKSISTIFLIVEFVLLICVSIATILIHILTPKINIYTVAIPDSKIVETQEFKDKYEILDKNGYIYILTDNVIIKDKEV